MKDWISDGCITAMGTYCRKDDCYKRQALLDMFQKNIATAGMNFGI